ncbi:hypothetical protein Tco_0199127 [Tanacetum coccineum]
MADVHRLSAHVIKLRDMPEGVLVLSGLSRVWKNRFCDPVLRGADGNVMGIHDFLCLPEWTGAEVQEEPHLDVRPTLQRLPFYCTPPTAADAVIPNPTLEDLAAGTPSSKILANAKASQKRKASTSGATSSHVAKRTRSAFAQSSSSTTRPSVFSGDDDESDDDDACVEIPLVTPLRSAAVIPSSGNQGGSFVAPTAEGSNTRAAALNEGLELQVSTLKKQVSGLNDKLATSDASFAKSKAKGKERKKKIKSLSKSLDNFHSEVARLSAALNQATILEAERDEEIMLEFKVNSYLWLPERLAEASLLVAQTDYAFLNKISEYAIEPLSVILQLEPKKLVRPANVPIPRDTRVSPLITKDSTMIPVSKSLELSANVVPASLAVSLEQNEEQVSAVVDGSDLKNMRVACHARSKSEGVFVQGTFYVLDDVAEVTVVGSKRVSSGLTDVVVALSAGEKGDGYALSSTFEEVVVPLSKQILSHAIRPKPNGFLLGTCSIAGQASVVLLDICYNYKSIQLLPLASWFQFGFAPSALLVTLPFLLLLVSSTDGLVLKPTDNSWLRNSRFIVARPVNTSAFRFKIFGRCVIRNLWNGTVASIISSL